MIVSIVWSAASSDLLKGIVNQQKIDWLINIRSTSYNNLVFFPEIGAKLLISTLLMLSTLNQRTNGCSLDAPLKSPIDSATVSPIKVNLDKGLFPFKNFYSSI